MQARKAQDPEETPKDDSVWLTPLNFQENMATLYDSSREQVAGLLKSHSFPKQFLSYNTLLN